MSTAIVPIGGSENSNVFTQQGTVDWTLLSGSTVNFTIEILARLSKAGVEPITAAMGQAIFAGFNLDPDGQIRFSDTISRLKAFSSYGNVMWFGFGVKHIIRTLSETEQGATCAAICACLSVSYDKFFCSKVLKALADQQKAPNSLMPSLSQWAALANICSGAVSSSRFPQLVEVYSRLTQSYDGDSRYALQETTSPDELARAILELGKVSSGTVQSVTFIGGVDCGWLAALAQWLLSLRVDIVAVDGSVLYSSRTSVDPSYYPQVSIVQRLGRNGQGKSTLIKKSVFVKPGRLFFDVKGDLAFDQRHFFSAGRSEWPTILHDTFGADFDALLHPEMIQDFAELLCCGFSASDSENGQRHVEPWGGLSTTSTESRLSQLSFAAQRLPELIPLRVIVVAGHIEWNGKILSMAKDGRNEKVPVSLGDLGSTFVQTYGRNVDLKLRVQETFTSDVLEADLWVSSKPIEPLQRISYHDGHIVDLPTASTSPTRIRTFGAAKIRSAIISSRLSTSCHSEPVETNALSIDGPICWSGPCSDAAKYLWVDGYNNKSYSPTSDEWALISQKRVTVHSFLGGGPSSQVLLTSAKFLSGTQTTKLVSEPDHAVSEVNQESDSGVVSGRPMLLSTPQTAQSPSEPEHAISGNDQLSDSSILPSQATLSPTSRPAQPPSELGHTTPDVDQKESDSSAILSQEIKGGIPDRGRDFKSSNSREIQRARSL
ncbi:hypothetical protein VE00_00700 [Pseudogymnoascus sp. WSF 3629]|nr:hypothetical protein VE00_00700 [Pseudogymnoascus sp. WSF 3629]